MIATITSALADTHKTALLVVDFAAVHFRFPTRRVGVS